MVSPPSSRYAGDTITFEVYDLLGEAAQPPAGLNQMIAILRQAAANDAGDE